MSAQTEIKKPSVKVGLTKQGVAILQSLFITLVVVLEILVRHGVGAISGVAICIATIGSVRFGRLGTEYVSAATAPLAFAFAAIIGITAVDGLHFSKLGVDLVAALASAAPYLLLSATYGWLNFLKSRRTKRSAVTK
ncbi:MAG: hypothetical protein NTX12_03195 [Actinobacteria bacterium]|nr:hypothetical protein [Actinomycetota bacterium]